MVHLTPDTRKCSATQATRQPNLNQCNSTANRLHDTHQTKIYTQKAALHNTDSHVFCTHALHKEPSLFCYTISVHCRRCTVQITTVTLKSSSIIGWSRHHHHFLMLSPAIQIQIPLLSLSAWINGNRPNFLGNRTHRLILCKDDTA